MKRILLACGFLAALSGYAAVRESFPSVLKSLVLARHSNVDSNIRSIDEKLRTSITEVLAKSPEVDEESQNAVKDILNGLRTESEVTGRWWFQNYVDGHQAEIVVHPDHTFTDAHGYRIGVWDIDDGQLIMRHQHRGGHTDYWQLPMTDNSLHGTNTPGQEMALWRM